MLQVPAVVVPFVMCDFYDTDWIGLLSQTTQFKPLVIKTSSSRYEFRKCGHEDHPKDALSSCQKCSFVHPEQTTVGVHLRVHV